MARTDDTSRRKEDGASGAAAFLARPLLLAVLAFLVVAGFIYFLRGEPERMLPAEVQPGASGAATEPQGIVEQDTGSTQQPVEEGDVIDNTSRSDNRPNILDAGEGADPATSVDELDVPDRVNPGVVEPGPPPAQD